MKITFNQEFNGTLIFVAGPIAIFIVLLYDWARDEPLDIEKSMSSLAIIGVLFGGVNMLV
jgi:hypothetical protein